jgi:hypothetical protein
VFTCDLEFNGEGPTCIKGYDLSLRIGASEQHPEHSRFLVNKTCADFSVPMQINDVKISRFIDDNMFFRVSKYFPNPSCCKYKLDDAIWIVNRELCQKIIKETTDAIKNNLLSVIGEVHTRT